MGNGAEVTFGLRIGLPSVWMGGEREAHGPGGVRMVVRGRTPYLTTTVYSYLTVAAGRKLPPRRERTTAFQFLPNFSGYPEFRGVKGRKTRGAKSAQFNRRPGIMSCARHGHVTL